MYVQQRPEVTKRVDNEVAIDYTRMNRPATSKLFNPNRLQSSIDFEYYGRASPKDINQPVPRTLRRQSAKPEPEIKSCITRSM